MEIRTKDEGRQHIREIMVEEEAVARVIITDYDIRFGAAQVRMAGVGGVYTHRKHRMKGYMRQLMADSVTYMIERGYDVSMLFGIPDFYTKFGYIACLPFFKCKVSTRDAEEAQKDAQPYPVRPSEAADMPTVLDLYHANNADRVCSIVRDPEQFTRFPKGSWYDASASGLLWHDSQGKLVAYAALNKSRYEVKVIEVEAVDRRLFPTLMYEFAKMAIERRCGDIAFYMPPDHLFAEFAQRYGCKWKSEYPKNGGGMMRILNLDAFFAKVCPELSRRLAHSLLRKYTGTLQIETDLGTVTLAIDQDGVKLASPRWVDAVLEVPQDKLIQWMVGYRRTEDVLYDPDVTAPERIVPLLDALFPKGIPYVWSADHF